jgi:hypothetical protein
MPGHHEKSKVGPVLGQPACVLLLHVGRWAGVRADLDWVSVEIDMHACAERSLEPDGDLAQEAGGGLPTMWSDGRPHRHNGHRLR